MINELLKEKEKLITENHQTTEQKLAPDDALKYLLTQSLLDAMLLNDVKAFDSLLEAHKDKIDILLRLNFYNLDTDDYENPYDANEYSANLSLLDYALDLTDEYFLKSLVPLVDPKLLFSETISNSCLINNDKNSFLKVVSYLPNEKSVEEFIAAIVKTGINLYNRNPETYSPNPFVEWILSFDFTAKIIYENTNYILNRKGKDDSNLYDLDMNSFFLILPHLEPKKVKELAENDYFIKKISTYYPYAKKNLGDIIKNLVKYDIISHNDEKTMIALKDKFIESLKAERRSKNQEIANEELEKLWLSCILKEKDTKKTKPQKI